LILINVLENHEAILYFPINHETHFNCIFADDKRYVVLLKGWVYYYKDRNSLVPQNYFSLKGYSTR